MRIVSGKFKGKTFIPPKGFNARPTTDFAKEGLFNILLNNFDFEEIEVLDVFAGTGSISFEFASRGTKRIDLVELNHQHLKFISKIRNELDLKQIHTIQGNAFQFLKACNYKYDIIFADPPYEMDGIEMIPALVFEKNLLKDDGWLILEHSASYSFETHARFHKMRNYGSVHFSIFRTEGSGEL
jgi:16S rRNA (guanine966-N2)-methyltransferase